MSTTAWRFSGTEGADAAVLRLKQLDAQEVMDVQDIAVLRWPQYASGPQVQEHVTEEGSKASSLAKRIKKAGIDGGLLQAVKDDMQLGTSALIVLSADAYAAQRRRLLRIGVDEYVTKPFKVAEMLDIVERFVTRPAGG